ncbi:MAG TPA: DHA2 family efflux MFS transporter permease subunit [Phycisphaerae bacterium]|nr:DHA2 family efflux MFS transporter permease subunit [Phycisphaerae bacterium]
MSAVTAERPRLQHRPAQASGTPSQPAFLRGHSPWLIAATVTLATFMEVLDTSIANVALPHIAGNLGAGQEESTWVLTSYLVANAIVLPLAGWMSILIGRKRFYMACVALFTISSFLCGLAPNLAMLIFFRVLQGIGGGGLQPSEQAILADTFPPKKRGMAFAFYGFAIVAAPAIGPTLGGWVTDNYTWRWIFFINIPVGITSLILTTFLIHDPAHLVNERRARRKKGFSMDYTGLGLIALGLGLLQYVLDKGNIKDWFGSRTILVCSIVAITALVVAVIWELSVKDPIVELRLLKNRNFAISNILMLMLGFVLLGSTALIPLLTQYVLGYTATLAGLVLSPGALAVMALMPLVGFLESRVDVRAIIAFGLITSAVGLFLMTHFATTVDYRHIAIGRIVQASGIAFLFIPISTLSYSTLKKTENTQASGLINLARNIGGSVGISISQTLVSRHTQLHQTYLAAHVTPANPNYRNAITHLTALLIHQGAAAADALRRAQAVLYQQLQQQATMLAYIDVFRIMAYFFLACLALLLFLQKPRTTQPAAH